MRVVRVVFGVLGLLVGAAAITGALMTLDEDRDPDDFFISDGHRLERSSFAITSEGIDVLSDAPGWVADRLTDPVDVRVSGSSNDGSDLFLGIGTSDDVEAYLTGVAYDEVDSIEFEGSDIDYVHHGGASSPGVPGGESFWATSVEGPGIQTLDWSIEQGEWTVVVMNADGSAGVDASLVFGARISNFVWVAWGVFAFGVFVMLGGVVLVLRRRGETKESIDPAGAGRSDRDWRFATTKGDSEMGVKFFEWINRRYRIVTVGVLVFAVLMAGAFAAMGSDDEPQFDPSGEIYETAQRVEDVFAVTSGSLGFAFLVEASDENDVLTRNALLEWMANSESLRAETRDVRGDPLNSHLTTVFSNDFGVEIDGVYSIAEAVDAELAGGLEGATDADVKVALDAVLAPNSPTVALRGTLSRLATATPDVVSGQQIEVWESPAFQALVMFDIDTFEVTTTSTDQEIIDMERFLEAEYWAREVQIELRGQQQSFTALGVGIDVNLSFEEQSEKRCPSFSGRSF